jgi:hydrogenase expression/formation protein HypC
MCLQVPGKVIDVKDNIAVIDYDIEQRQAIIADIPVKKGDWALVVGRFVIEKVPESVGRESLNHWKDTMLQGS